MPRLNVATCELTWTQEQGRFRCRGEAIGERLGGRAIGAAVYEMDARETNWPYHIHYGVEEWMYVVSGSPVLREQSGERQLAPGTLVAFAVGPAGSHTVSGPGRVVIFSAGDDGWDVANASVYPDSDKLAVAGMMFRRADALQAWTSDPPQPMREVIDGASCPAVNLMTVDAGPLAGPLGTRTWSPTLGEIAPGQATAPYHYEHRREEWALVVYGAPTLRHPDGEDVLAPCDIVSFPAGPSGARRLSNSGPEPARLLLMSTPVGTSTSVVHPDDGTIVVSLPDRQSFRFRLSDRIEDYWDGEPGAQ